MLAKKRHGVRKKGEKEVWLKNGRETLNISAFKIFQHREAEVQSFSLYLCCSVLK